MICFQSVKWVLGFVYYLCLGLNLKGVGGVGGVEKEKRGPSISERRATLSNCIQRYSSF